MIRIYAAILMHFVGSARKKSAVTHPRRMQVSALEQVVAVTAVRTGSGKSQASAYVNRVLCEHHIRTTVVRHPMPYGGPLAAMLACWAGLGL